MHRIDRYRIMATLGDDRNSHPVADKADSDS
jgi:hypothetical protein